MSLETFAETIRITPDHLDEIENGLQRASAELLVNIAQMFGVAPSYYFELAMAPAHALRT